MLDPTESGYAAAEQLPDMARRARRRAVGRNRARLVRVGSRPDQPGDRRRRRSCAARGHALRRGTAAAGAGCERRPGGRSVAAAAAHLDWFAPLHGYDDVGRARKIAAARHEAELLGVIAGDRLTVLGELLVEEREPAPLAARAAGLLPDTRGLLVVQSDLTALVSGQPTAATAGLLAACAVPENRDAATVWRFTPASVRSALDTGWTVDELRSGTGRGVRPTAAATRGLPVRRRRPTPRQRQGPRRRRTCLTGAEAEIAEIAHTKGLAKLRLSQIAPTVLTSPIEVDVVLTGLRAAGFSPMPEGADGTVGRPSSSRTTSTATPPGPRTPSASTRRSWRRGCSRRPA